METLVNFKNEYFNSDVAVDEDDQNFIELLEPIKNCIKYRNLNILYLTLIQFGGVLIYLGIFVAIFTKYYSKLQPKVLVMLSVNLLVQVVCSAMLLSIESIRNFFTKNKINEPDFAISSVELNLLFLFNILTSIIV